MIKLKKITKDISSLPAFNDLVLLVDYNKDNQTITTGFLESITVNGPQFNIGNPIDVFAKFFGGGGATRNTFNPTHWGKIELEYPD